MALSAARWGGLAALAVLVALALRRVDPGELRRALATADVPLLLAATGLDLLSLAMQTGRWLSIVRPIAPRVRARDGFFTLVAGFAVGLVVPARASDLARAHLMARCSGVSMATLTATAFVDHLLGSVALLGVTGLVAAVSELPGWLRTAGTGAFGVAGALLAALWILRPRPGAGPPRVRGLGGFLDRLRQGLVAVGRPRSLALAWTFALGGWATEVLIAWLALRAFGLPSSVQVALLCVVATTLSSALSVSPGNVGTFQLACVLALATLGVGREVSLAFSLGYHAVHLVPVVLVGGGWLLAHGYKGGLVHQIP